MMESETRSCHSMKNTRALVSLSSSGSQCDSLESESRTEEKNIEQSALKSSNIRR